MGFVPRGARSEERGRDERAMRGTYLMHTRKCVKRVFSGVLASLPVILSVLSVSNHARIAWYRWFCAPRSSKTHRTTLYHVRYLPLKKKSMVPSPQTGDITKQKQAPRRIADCFQAAVPPQLCLRRRMTYDAMLRAVELRHRRPTVIPTDRQTVIPGPTPATPTT